MTDENKMQVNVTWDGAIGEVDQDAFKSNLPEGLEPEHFDKVDTYRDQFAAAVTGQLVERAPTHFANSEDDLSVMETSLGGNATLAVTMNNDKHVTAAISIATGEALDAVLTKAQELISTTMTE